VDSRARDTICAEAYVFVERIFDDTPRANRLSSSERSERYRDATTLRAQSGPISGRGQTRRDTARNADAPT